MGGATTWFIHHPPVTNKPSCGTSPGDNWEDPCQDLTALGHSASVVVEKHMLYIKYQK